MEQEKIAVMRNRQKVLQDEVERKEEMIKRKKQIDELRKMLESNVKMRCDIEQDIKSLKKREGVLDAQIKEVRYKCTK